MSEERSFIRIYFETMQNNLKNLIIILVFGFTAISLYLGLVRRTLSSVCDSGPNEFPTLSYFCCGGPTYGMVHAAWK